MKIRVSKQTIGNLSKEAAVSIFTAFPSVHFSVTTVKWRQGSLVINCQLTRCHVPQYGGLHEQNFENLVSHMITLTFLS
jgi:hypothetical protein